MLDVCCTPSRETKEVIKPPTPQPEELQQTGCGIRNVNGIDFALSGNVNGESGYGEFPWTVALLSGYAECLCGASLIHPSVVLTGAHCVFNLTADNLKIRAGEWDTQTTKERLPYQERSVKAVITHPEFHTKTLANDIVKCLISNVKQLVIKNSFQALLILTQPVQIDQHVNVICLPSQGYFSNSPVSSDYFKIPAVS